MANKKTTRAQRGLLFLASGLVLIMGIILFFLSDFTEMYFAWTIGVPLTAAFLGGGYLSSFILEFMSAREHEWKNSRIAIPAVFLFTSLTFIITLLHIDKFHLGDEEQITLFITWAWIVVYGVVPILMIVVLIHQLTMDGEVINDDSLPKLFKIILVFQGLIMLVFGIGMLLFPTDFIPFWPWAQTPLTAKAIGAWLIGLGVAVFHTVYENNWKSIHPILLSYVSYAILQLINLVRYPNAKGLDWSAVNTILYVLFFISVLIIGIYGLVSNKQSSQK